MSSEWDEYADGWDTDDSVKEYASKAFDTLTQAIDINHDFCIFDFGCGTGSLTERLSPIVKEVVALDTSPEMIKHLDKKAFSNVTSIADTLSDDLLMAKPSLVGTFDLVVASSVCAFLPNYEETLGVISTLLKPSGKFVQWDWLAADEESPMGMTENKIYSGLESNGFTDIRISKPFSMESEKGSMDVLMAIAQKV